MLVPVKRLRNVQEESSLKRLATWPRSYAFCASSACQSPRIDSRYAPTSSPIRFVCRICPLEKAGGYPYRRRRLSSPPWSRNTHERQLLFTSRHHSDDAFWQLVELEY